MRGVISILLVALVLASCESSHQLMPLMIDAKQEEKTQLLAPSYSYKSSTIAIQPVKMVGMQVSLPSLLVSIFNPSDDSTGFSIENIQVFVDRIPHRLVSADTVITTIKEQRGWTKATSVLTNAAQLLNPTSFAAANIQAQRGARSKQKSLSGLQVRQKSDWLTRVTVSPDSWQSGYITLDTMQDISKPHDIRIIVDVMNEQHEFRFTVARCQLANLATVASHRTRESQFDLCWQY